MQSQHPRQSTASYSQWVRCMLNPPQADRKAPIHLFESSVPEPVSLLSELVGSSFGWDVTSRYESAFAGGNPYVKAKLAETYGVPETGVVTTTGATGALSLIYRALLRQGDRVLVENPGFDLFGILAEAHGFGVDRFERAAPSFAVDPAAVEAAIGPQTRIVVLSNLHNPSGHGIADDVMRQLGEMADRRNVVIVVDEVYLPYAGASAKSAVQLGLSPRIVAINSLTKIYGLSTLRCGWIVGDPAVVQPIHALSREVEFSISKLSHAVAALVLERPEPFEHWTQSIVAAARPIMESFHALWSHCGVVDGELPEHGCIAFPRLTGIADTRHFSDWLAKERGVMVAPGEYFGAAGHLRIGFATDPGRLRDGLRLLTEGMQEYGRSFGKTKKEEQV